MIASILIWTAGSLAFPTESENLTEDAATVAADDELSWYKPIAVILKPASERDLRDRLLETENEDPFQFRSNNQYQPPPPSWPSVREYSSYDPWAGYHPARRFGGDDRLRDVYQKFQLPSKLQGNLLSLARMGLVAIPTKEIGIKNAAEKEETGEKMEEV